MSFVNKAMRIARARRVGLQGVGRNLESARARRVADMGNQAGAHYVQGLRVNSNGQLLVQFDGTLRLDGRNRLGVKPTA